MLLAVDWMMVDLGSWMLDSLVDPLWLLPFNVAVAAAAVELSPRMCD